MARDPYSRQKRYLKKRYGVDLAYREARKAQMKKYRRAKYAGDPAFREGEKRAQRERYAREAALLSIRNLFTPCQPATRRRGVEGRLLQFCPPFSSGSGPLGRA